jgi:protein-disulfide isomerase
MRKSLLVWSLAPALIAAGLPFCARAAKAAPADKKTEGITREQADQILEELRNIRQLLENQQNQQGQTQKAPVDEPAKPAAARFKLSAKGAQMLGDKDAPITIIEFTDYQCPYCRMFHANTFGELKKQYIDTGKVRFFSRDLPLENHADAMRAAMAGRCAADQKRFWELRDIMAANPDKLDMKSLVKTAESLKLDVKAFRECIESEKYKNAVQTDIMDAKRIGADGTPTFVVGKSTSTGVDGELLVGALPFEEFEKTLKQYE